MNQWTKQRIRRTAFGWGVGLCALILSGCLGLFQSREEKLLAQYEYEAPLLEARPLDATFLEALVARESALLNEYGIGDDEAAITDFLTNGFPAAQEFSELPNTVDPLSELLIHAITVAAVRQYDQTWEPLMRIAQGQYSSGHHRIMIHDTRDGNQIAGLRKMRAIQQTLSGNAVIALGLMGDTRSRDFLTRTYRAERVTRDRIVYAMALGAVGSAESIPFLVDTVGEGSPEDAVNACQALRFLLGKNWELNLNNSILVRRLIHRDMVKYLGQLPAGFAPDPVETRMRRLARPDIQPVATEAEPQTVLDWVLIGADPERQRGKYGARDAFRQLTDGGVAVLDDLEAIMLDEIQDTPARIFATQTYLVIIESNREALGDRADDVLNRLADSVDEKVAELARNTLESLRRDETDSDGPRLDL